jgi:hypothetical protein
VTNTSIYCGFPTKGFIYTTVLQLFTTGGYGFKFEKVTQFKYLGTSVSYSNDLSVEINNRIISANRSYYGLKKQLKSHLLSTQTKIKLYKTLARPVLMYGCESWSLTKNEENKINIF